MKSILALACTVVATTFYATALWATSYNNNLVTTDSILIELHIGIADNSSNPYTNQFGGTVQDLKITTNTPLQSVNLLINHSSLLSDAQATTNIDVNAPAITINITLPQISAGKEYEDQVNTYPRATLSSAEYHISQLNYVNNQPTSKQNYNSQPIDMPFKNDLYIPLTSNQNINPSSSFNNNFQQHVVVNNQQNESAMPQHNKLSYQSADLFDDLYNKPKQVMF